MAVATKTGRVGADILLVRHGDRIVKLRQDRRNDRTVALLEDGTTDHAPNSITEIKEPALAASGTPFGRLVGVREAYAKDELPIARAELKAMGWFTLVWGAVSVAVTGGLVWMASEVVTDPNQLSLMMSAY